MYHFTKENFFSINFMNYKSNNNNIIITDLFQYNFFL